MSEQPAVYEPLSARERLLAAANELFYEEGVNTVGIDRIIERAGVAKASLYNTFGSKDALVRPTCWRAMRRDVPASSSASNRSPLRARRLPAIFDEMHDRARSPASGAAPSCGQCGNARRAAA